MVTLPINLGFKLENEKKKLRLRMMLHPFLVNDLDYFNFYELQQKKDEIYKLISFNYQVVGITFENCQLTNL